VVVGGHGIVLLAFATTMVSVLFQLVRLSMVKRILPGTRINPRLVDPAQRRVARNLSGWFLVQAVLMAIYATGDVMIVGIVLGLRDAAIYAVGSKLAGAVISGLDSMAQVFFPYVSSIARNKDRKALGTIAIDGTRVTMVPGLMIALVFIVLAYPGIHAWVGSGYGVSAQVLIVLAAGTALASPIRVFGNVLGGAGAVKTACAIRGIEVPLNIVLSIILGRVMGPVGVAVGTLGGILLVRLPGFMVAGCRLTDVPVRRFIRAAMVPNVLPAVACAAVLLVMRPVAGNSIPLLVAATVAGCAAYLLVYFATGATGDERHRARAFVTRPLPQRWRFTVAGPPNGDQDSNLDP
jgi:O-antigen/teichoic acid export membrane protein